MSDWPVPAGYRALTEGAGLLDRQAAVIGVAGPDAAAFLDGQLSVTASKLEAGAGADALLLSPQGRLVAVGYLLCCGEGEFLYVVDRRVFDAAAERLVHFHMRVDCDVYGDEDLGLWSVLGPEAGNVAAAAFGVEVPPAEAPLAHVPIPDREDWRLVRARSGGLGGAHLLCTRERPDVAGTVAVDRASFDARRVEVGAPLFGVDYDESTIPHEAGLVPRAVDLDKGCYVGQELIERIYSRGHTNRGFRRVRFAGDDVPTVGSLVVDATGKEVGSLTTTAWCPQWDGPGGLGFLRREVAPGDPVTAGATAIAGVLMD